MPDVDLSQLFKDAKSGKVADRAEMALEAVGVDVVAWLREFIEATSPPVRQGEGERQQRRGGWADVTGRLAGAYEFDVARTGKNELTLTVSNPTEYAEALEAREGLFVISGAFETEVAAAFLQKRFYEAFGVELPVGTGGPSSGA